MPTHEGVRHGNGIRKVLIIGGGFAGLECARNLSNDDRFEVTLVDRTNHHLFQPLLYQVATASLTGPDIARSIRQILAKAKNVTVLMDEILGIDTDTRSATGKSGTVYGYDYLLLAAGARRGGVAVGCLRVAIGHVVLLSYRGVPACFDHRQGGVGTP